MNRRDFLRRSALTVAGLYLGQGLATRKAVAALTEAPSGIPVGYIGREPFPGALVPGLVRCDGRLLKVKDYPKLYAVIGNTYGPLPNKRIFRAPDLRGLAVARDTLKPRHLEAARYFETTPYHIKAA